ncbi:NYN domain-containing protein [Candidatus Bipolaricaulota bacterium]|nr:NYN domain-containing protein [Candidatus Bipolaricaulota bacterium]
MPSEPEVKRAITFIDGQNLFHVAREAFGYTYPNYDILCLSRTVCQAQGWNLAQARFYTGIPDFKDDYFWSRFWAAKLLAMTRQGIHVFSRTLRYRNKVVNLPDGTKHSFLVGEEKGIDVRLALDIVRMAHRAEYDVAVVFSQDQDLSEAAGEIRHIAREQGRWIKIASAFPISPTVKNRRGIDKTDWIRIDRSTYDACLDPRDYRPKTATASPSS